MEAGRGTQLRETYAFVAILGTALAGCTQSSPAPASSASATASTPTASAAPAAVSEKPQASPAPTPTGAPATTAAPSGGAGAPGTRSFDADRADAAPAGFAFGRTGSGALGRWVVRAEADAPSPPNVLAQLDADDTDNRYPVAVVDTPSLSDARISVRCKMVSGKVDQACGLVFRYRDENNYYITRANALESNIRFYTVKEGRRKQLASYSGTVTAGKWHEYAVEIRGDHIQVFWDGQKILDHHDATFPEAGRIGVWTKADSVTYFDDLSAAPL